MDENLKALNAYIQTKKLPLKLKVFSDGENYMLMYQSIFAGNKDSWEQVSSVSADADTYGQLIVWIDVELSKPQPGLLQA